jgi:hypothetical protein
MVVTFFRVSMMTPKEVLLAELRRILIKAQKQASEDLLDTTSMDFTLDDGMEFGKSLPPMNLSIQVAMLKGLQVLAFNKLSHHAQHARRSWHLKVDSKHAAKMKRLVQCAKEYGCVEEFWGCHAHLSEMTYAKSTPHKSKRQVDVAQSHTNYQMSMTVDKLVRIIKLDKLVEIVHPTTFKMVGTLTMRMILLNYLKMQDSHPIIAEVHQEDICTPMHVIIPQAKEAERMVCMMHKNLPAFLHHMLLDIGFTNNFIKKFLKKTCKALLVGEIPLCKWDSDTCTLITPANKKYEKEL